MKITSSVLVSALLATLLLTACGEKAEEAAPVEEAPVAETAPAETVPAPEPAPSAGGYEPTADERVPGITMSPEELAAAAEEAPAEAPADGS
jgi:hypothetical protein